MMTRDKRGKSENKKTVAYDVDTPARVIGKYQRGEPVSDASSTSAYAVVNYLVSNRNVHLDGRKKGTEVTASNSENFNQCLLDYIRDHSQLAEAVVVEHVRNTAPHSPAVIWRHGPNFQGRPWNAKNKHNAPFNEKQLEKRVRPCLAQVRRERAARYGAGTDKKA